MPNDLLSLSLSIVGAAITVAVTFYIKDFLEKRSEYTKLRSKLERIAGKNANVIYIPTGQSAFGGSPPLYKVLEIDEHGVTLANEVQTVFIPVGKLLQAEIILPSDNYDKARLAAMKKSFDEIADAMVEPMIKRLIPIMRDVVLDELEQGEQVSAVLGVKITSALKESGFEIKKLPDR